MTESATKLWTYEDYLALPDDGNRYEIVEGELLVTPPPTTGHQSISSRLFLAMGVFIAHQKLGMLYHPPFEIHLSDQTRPVQPDLIFIRAENDPLPTTVYFRGIPDLVVEILSPGSHRNDMTVKYAAYEKAGIPEYWIVDPKSESVWVYALSDGKNDLHGQFVGEEMITSKVLAGLEIVNRSLFTA